MEYIHTATVADLVLLALYILINIGAIVSIIRITDRKQYDWTFTRRLGYILLWGLVTGALKVGLILLYVNFR